MGTEHVSFIQGTTVRALARDGGTYIGMFDTGDYVTTVVDLSTGATVATVHDESPTGWLSDNRPLVSPQYRVGGTYLLSPAFNTPTTVPADQPRAAVGARLEAAGTPRGR